jgi:hypothetical protein
MTLKQGVSIEAKARVLDLRRRYSIREVAEQTGMPVGTVKTICSRSGAFRDNQAHRALFCLPLIRESSQTLPAVPDLPPQQRVTGDKEDDAVLWLRKVIGTGQAALIEKAMQGAKKIKTPLKEVEKRYQAWLMKENPGSLFAALSSFDFANLEGLAKNSIKKAARQHEARARFGDDLFSDTPAESFCITALHGVEDCRIGFIDDDVADERFQKHSELLPNTLSDCLHEIAYWNDLSSLRYSVESCADGPPEAYARRCSAFRMLGRIRPRSKDEALAVLRWMLEDKQNNMGEGDDNDAILLNLIS